MQSAHATKCACGDCHRKRLADGTQEAYERELRAETDRVLRRIKEDNEGPHAASKQSAEGAVSSPSAAATNAGNAIVEAKRMPGGDTESGFLKNLFETVQRVKYDSKCPHGEPFYACMCCSH